MAQAILTSNTSVNASYNDIAFDVNRPNLTFTTTTSDLFVTDNAGDTVFNDQPVDPDQLVTSDSDTGALGLTAGTALRAYVLLEITDGTNTFDLYIIGPTAVAFDASAVLNSVDYIFVSEPAVDTNATYTFTGNFNNTADIPYSLFSSSDPLLVCFSRGTNISAGDGQQVPVQDLNVGDLVRTGVGEPRPIRWIVARKVTSDQMVDCPNLRPVRITAGALGNGLPERDLLVSRQHRMLIPSKIAHRMFGGDALVSAIKLTSLAGIYVDERVEEIEYFHILFDRHEIIYAEGAPTESLFTGPEALKAVSPKARHEILELFPELADRDYVPDVAAIVPTGKSQKKLISRHIKNNQPLLIA